MVTDWQWFNGKRCIYPHKLIVKGKTESALSGVTHHTLNRGKTWDREKRSVTTGRYLQ